MSNKRRYPKQKNGFRLKVQTPSGIWMTYDVTTAPPAGVRYQDHLINYARSWALRHGTAAVVETTWGAVVARIECPYAWALEQRKKNGRKNLVAVRANRFDWLQLVNLQLMKQKEAQRGKSRRKIRTTA